MEIVAQLVRDAGFDAVIVGALARGKEFEPGTPKRNSRKPEPRETRTGSVNLRRLSRRFPPVSAASRRGLHLLHASEPGGTPLQALLRSS